MPTFQNDAEINDRNFGTNKGFKTPISVQGQNTNIGKKTNSSNKNATLNKNSLPTGSESPLQSKVHQNFKIPQTSLKFKDSFVPKCSDFKYESMNDQSIPIPSKSTLISTPSTRVPHQPQSNQIQVKKNFTVYTDSENSNTKNDQVSKKDISFAKGKTNVHKTANHGKITSTPLAVKDISNTFITPKSIPPTKTSCTTELKYPSCKLSKMKSTPPLCHCGRRAKLSLSHTPGANMGRKFFTCGLKGGNINSKNRSVTACNFFKWDTDHLSVFLSNQSLQSSSIIQSSVSSSAKSKENCNVYNSSTSFRETNSAENTPVLKKTKVRPYQLL